ncbi:MAG: dicarboxylate/amino acid:cation symporter [Bacteroidetes bacterium]|nr:dicarboxylate/amino acid:cation symporter [Bacteroidota bacterium]
MKLPKLHIQILIGLILGIIFGYLFGVKTNELKIISLTGVNTIKDWSDVSFLQKDSVLKSFNGQSQLSIIRFFDTYKKSEKLTQLKLKITYPDNNSAFFENIKSLERESSIASDIKPIGEIFIRLLNMIAVPLVLASLIVGAASLHDLKNVLSIGGKTLGFYLLTAVLTITSSMVLAVLVNPGSHITPDAKARLLDAFKDEAVSTTNYKFDLINFFVEIVPKNPFKGLVEGDFLQIVLFAILTGLFLSFIPKDKSKKVIDFFDGISQAMIKMVEAVIKFAPIAVFALISSTVSEFGFSILQTLIYYFFTVIVALLISTFVIYPVLLKLFSGANVIDFFKTQRQVMAVAFTTSSSSATMPINLDVCENVLKIPNKIVSFILPLGTTINKDGTALYQAISAIFIAQVYGFELSIPMMLTIFVASLITGAATAPVAGAGLIMLVVVLKAAGLPIEGVALILGIDRLLNMSRAVTNVVADSVCCVVVAKSEGEFKGIPKLLKEN